MGVPKELTERQIKFAELLVFNEGRKTNPNRFYTDDLIYIRIEGPNIYKSFYSTSDSSVFEYWITK